MLHPIPAVRAAVGVLVGAGIAFVLSKLHDDAVLAYERFDFDFFIVWLLPPIIFEAGFNMDVQSFFRNIYPTIFFAFAGTFVSTFIIGGIVWGVGQLGLCYPMGLLSALSFGSVISATDPVTVSGAPLQPPTLAAAAFPPARCVTRPGSSTCPVRHSQ